VLWWQPCAMGPAPPPCSAERLACPLPAVMAALVEAELDGWLCRMPGNQYEGDSTWLLARRFKPGASAKSPCKEGEAGRRCDNHDQGTEDKDAGRDSAREEASRRQRHPGGRRITRQGGKPSRSTWARATWSRHRWGTSRICPRPPWVSMSEHDFQARVVVIEGKKK